MKKNPRLKAYRHRNVWCLRRRIKSETTGKSQVRWRQIDPSIIDDENAKDAVWEQWTRDLLNGKTKPQAGTAKPKTLADDLEDFHADLTTVASAKNAGQTRSRAEAVLREIGVDLSKPVVEVLRRITPGACRIAINRIRCTPRKPKRDPKDYPLLSDRSRHHFARAIKQFIAWLHSEGRIADDPLHWRKWKLKRFVEERNPRDRLQPAELNALVRTAYASVRIVEGYDGQTRGWLYLLGSMTGLRRGELAALTPSCFDLAAKTVSVAAAYTKAKKPAVLPLTAPLVADLTAWLATIEGSLFPALAQKRTSKMMVVDLKAADVPFKTETGSRCFHSLRNTYISQLFDAGLGVDDVQRYARHSEVGLTMKYAKQWADAPAKLEKLNYPGLR